MLNRERPETWYNPTCDPRGLVYANCGPFARVERRARLSALRWLWGALLRILCLRKRGWPGKGSTAYAASSDAQRAASALVTYWLGHMRTCHVHRPGFNILRLNALFAA